MSDFWEEMVPKISDSVASDESPPNGLGSGMAAFSAGRINQRKAALHPNETEERLRVAEERLHTALAAARAMEGELEQYRTLFTRMDEGFCVVEMEFDESGRATDCRIELMNPAFVEHTGMSGLVGKSIRQAIPELEEVWYETYGRVATTGVPIRFVHRAAPIDGRWFDVHAFRLGGAGSKRVAVLFNDVTARRLAEEQLRASEERNTYLIALADALRPLSDPTATQAEACRVLGQRLGANRVLYFEVQGDRYVVAQDYTDAVLSIVGRYPIASFSWDLLATYQAGRTAVASDVNTLALLPAEKETYAALQIGAYVGAPVVKGGTFVGGLAVHSTTPRAWTPTEIAMIEDTAERTWAAVERTQAEAALRESEERSAFVRRSSGIGFWYCDLPFDILQWDDLVKAHFHLPPDTTVTIQTFYERLHPDDREPTRVAIEESIADRTPYNVDYRTVHPVTGVVTWVRAIGRTLHADDGTPIRFDGVTLDVTEEKRVEAELRDGEQRMRLATEATSVGIWHWNVSTGQVLWDAQMFRIYGMPPTHDGLVDYATWIAAVLPEDLAHQEEVLRQTVRSGGKSSREFRIRRASDGACRTLQSFETVRTQVNGQVDWVVGTNLDITERTKAESELRRLAAELSEADRRKGLFLATLAHELRNPLAPIRTGLEVIRMVGANDTIERARSMMERQLVQMVRLVDDLLDMNRVTSGKLELRRATFDLRAVLDTAVETTRPLIEQARHELTIAVPPQPIWVDGDHTRLAQVVSNLLNNSAKYMHPGGRIRLRVGQEGDQATVSVADDGIGIPPAQLEEVFKMFAQLDRKLEKTTGGLGIGLSLVKGLVEMHGGTIEARSAGADRGSEFVVRLPVVSPAVQSVTTRGANEPVDSCRILVADDNADSAEMLAQLLELLGNDVSMANDGLQALQLAETLKPHLILLDIGMPKLNGYETCRRIREQPWGKHMVLVAVSGWGQPEDMRRSEAAGFNRHLVKPVDPSVLEQLLKSLSADAI